MAVFEIATDRELDAVRGWYRARGLAVPVREWFGHGFWVPGVAACFLYLTDSRRAYVEDLTTNPAESAAVRHVALLELGERLEQEARKAGVRYLVGWTQEEDVAERGRSGGYHPIGVFHGFAKILED